MPSKSRIVLKKVFSFLLHFLILVVQIFLFLVVFYRVVPVPLTPLMVIRMSGMDKEWVPMSNISKNVVIAAMTSEDPKFAEHWGFDLDAIQKAVEKSEKKGKRLNGASTISQQTSKNLFLWPHRSWLRKGLEVPVTLTLELMWTKKRIMEVYLNIIEMGDGVYGIQAAAQKYYKKDASQLTASESAMIVVCFPNPRRWTPVKPTPFIKKKHTRIVKWMNGFNPVPDWWYGDAPQK